jgi:N-glycosidase YbiA
MIATQTVVDALRELVELKAIKRKIDAACATDDERERYRLTKHKAWLDAEAILHDSPRSHARTKGNYDPNESPEAKATRLAQIEEFVSACNAPSTTEALCDAIDCTRCGNKLTTEERQHPEKEDGTEDIICGQCWNDLYLDDCERCGESAIKTELEANVGEIVGVWNAAPALGQDDLKAGYYFVRKWPFYADGMVEGHFFADALERIGDLDSKGLRRAQEGGCLAGPICRTCRGEAALSLLKAPSAIRDTLDTAERVCFYEQEFYVLSNFSSFKVNWLGVIFDTSEHAYHWTRFPNGSPERTVILESASAHDAFRFAQENKAHQLSNWDAVKVGVMRDILRAKAEQHEYVRRKLLETGERQLVENSWRDDFWGWGPNRDGRNTLGRLWMEVREEMRRADGGAA